jgi:hypothetical protein
MILIFAGMRMARGSRTVLGQNLMMKVESKGVLRMPKHDDPIADAIETLAVHVKYLGTGDAATTMGALEHLAVEIREGCKEIVQAIEKLAEAIENHGD